MAARRILLLGDPLLRERSTPVQSLREARRILADLRDTLAAFRREHGFGRGISAVQIGEPKRILYLEFEGASLSVVNPECEARSPETFRLWDDCFSFPGLLVYLERHTTVSIRYQDENGDDRRLEVSGALSELLQHELDHLDGVLAVDRAIGPNGLALREELQRQRAAGAVSGPFTRTR